MNEELINRIDEWLAWILPDDLVEILQDCRTEIERLTLSLKDSQALNLKFAQDREAADAKIERLDKPVRYVTMTEKQRAKWWSSDWSNGVMLWKFEHEVIRRAIAQGAKLEVQE